jgi:peptidoglycan/xylan/chitin deacetylase (PgdA/CDA1 family)
MMRGLATAGCALSVLVATVNSVIAADCPGHPDAIGTSRVLTVDPAQYRSIATTGLSQMLPLRDHELVLTFDDGPKPGATDKVLDALAAQCAKATFFIIGEMAKNSPELVRRAFDEGHAIGTHTETHPHLSELPDDQARLEIDRGFDDAAAALGPKRAVSPFFRAPYLDITDALERYLGDRGTVLWGADFQADDWSDFSGDDMVKLVLGRIEAVGRGVLVLHDVMAPTVEGLPRLLRELHARGYHVVQVAPVPTAMALSASAVDPSP